MKNILLDTNAYSLMISTDKKIQSELDGCDVVYIPTIVIGELFAGYEGGVKREANIKILIDFLKHDNVRVLKTSYETAKIYGKMTNILNKKGTPIPSNDVWIAACAIETNLVLVSYDKHFLKVPGLRVWDNLKE